MRVEKWQRLIFTAVATLCGSSFLLVGMLVYLHMRDKALVIQQAKDLAQNQAAYAAKEIDKKLRAIMLLTDSLAKDLNTRRFTMEEVLGRLKATCDKDLDYIFEVGLGYAPFAGDPRMRLLAPHYGRQDGSCQFYRVEKSYDYTGYDWYKNTLAHGPNWIEPYFGRATRSLVTGYSVPFNQWGSVGEKRVPAGVARINVSLGGMKKLVQSLDLGKTGYGFVLSKKGTFIVHPTEAYTNSHKTIFDLAATTKDPAIQAMGESALRGKRGLVEHIDKVTGQSSWIIYEPIPAAGWSLGVVFIKDEILQRTKTSRRELIWISLAALAFLFFLCVLAVGAHKGGVHRLWTAAIVVSLLGVAGIGYIWYLALTTSADEDRQQIKLLDRAGLDRFLASIARPKELGKESPTYVPTGVFVQSIEFSSANNVALTGYIWQKYMPGAQDRIRRGFVLPEASSSEVVPAYERKQNGVEIVGWFFKATLRQEFNYLQYPFDRQDVWLRIWHKDFDRNVILTPDLESYQLLNPTSLPGLERDFVLGGWSIEKSFFSYRMNSYNTNFGIENYVGQENFPEIYFNIALKRDFINPFVSNMIPLFIVAIMTFAVLIITTKHESKVALHGFNTAAVLTYCAALFFVVILSHIDLRGKLVAREIIYLEYFYIVMYLTLLWVSVNTILFAGNFTLRFIQYHDNLIPQLLYWPVIQGILLVITVVSFY
jgi:Cache domain